MPRRGPLFLASRGFFPGAGPSCEFVGFWGHDLDVLEQIFGHELIFNTKPFPKIKAGGHK